MTTPSPANGQPIGVQRLVLCFDGTWNTAEDQTNVSRIYSAIADQHSGCASQLKFYDEGVGTATGTRLRGGAIGLGLDRNILEGYCWLVNQWIGRPGASSSEGGEAFDAGPDIFLFGFSRGAYTARSLAGLINRCGLPRKDLFAESGGIALPDADVIREAWELYRKDFGDKDGRTECAEFRQRFSHNVKIRFIGVWDTVGALGVPMFSTRGVFSRLRYGFHDTSLGRVIENAYHAIAIDEHRKDYQVALWDPPKHGFTREVEQRWFPGAHANVGGGYEDDLLPDPPLRWIALHAIEHGLEFVDEMMTRLREEPRCKATMPQDFELRGDEYLSPVRDSYAHFLFGVYRVLRFIRGGRHYRPMLTGAAHETIDETAQMKWNADPRYRPRNFAHAGRADATSRVTPVIASAAPETSGGA